MRKFHFRFGAKIGHDSILSEVVIQKFWCNIVKTTGFYSDGEFICGERFVEVVDKDVTRLELQYLEKVISLTMNQKIVFESDE